MRSSRLVVMFVLAAAASAFTPLIPSASAQCTAGNNTEGCRCNTTACTDGTFCSSSTSVCGDVGSPCQDGGDCFVGACRQVGAARACPPAPRSGRCVTDQGCEGSLRCRGGMPGAGSAPVSGFCACSQTEWYSFSLGRCTPAGTSSGCGADQWVTAQNCTGFQTAECGVCLDGGTELNCATDEYVDSSACDGSTQMECGVCAACDPSCETCSGPAANQCLSCATGSPMNGSCAPVCHSTCATCSGSSANQCTSCDGTRTLASGACLLNDGQRCRANDDCLGRACVEGMCQTASTGVGGSCDDDADCASPQIHCARGGREAGICGGLTAACSDNEHCVSRFCDGRTGCAPRPMDAGSPMRDAGTPMRDAGSARDGGPIGGRDGGPSADAGPMSGGDAGPMSGVDAGPMSGVDAGPMPGVDAGGALADAGSAENDAGSRPGDGGAGGIDAGGSGADAGAGGESDGACAASPGRRGSGAPWALLGLAGAVALGRRRR